MDQSRLTTSAANVIPPPAGNKGEPQALFLASPVSRFFSSFAVSSCGLAIMFYFAEPGRLVPTGMVFMSLVMGVFASLVIYVPLCGAADRIRRRLQWPAWSICPVAAVLSLILAGLLWLCLNEQASGFRSVGDVIYYGLGVIFCPSLLFGIPYTASHYIRRPKFSA